MNPACETCHGDGWKLDLNLDAVLCDECDGIPTRRPHNLPAALSALIDAHRGNRSPAYAGATNYVPIAVLEGLLSSPVVTE